MSEANNYGRDETKILVRKQKEPLPLFGCFGGAFWFIVVVNERRFIVASMLFVKTCVCNMEQLSR